MNIYCVMTLNPKIIHSTYTDRSLANQAAEKIKGAEVIKYSDDCNFDFSTTETTIEVSEDPPKRRNNGDNVKFYINTFDDFKRDLSIYRPSETHAGTDRILRFAFRQCKQIGDEITLKELDTIIDATIQLYWAGLLPNTATKHLLRTTCPHCRKSRLTQKDTK